MIITNQGQKDLREFIFQEKNKSYSQDWSAYDKAKTNEDQLLKHLLIELLKNYIKDDIIIKKGRKSFPTEEKIFIMCMKIYYKTDLRKCQSILKELAKLGYINKVPCFKSIDNFFNDESLDKVLDDLIFISALPLASLEKTGAMDSTGFALSRFERWHNYKWGKVGGKERVWRKAHAVSGCKTNTVLSVKVTEKNVGDASMLEKTIGERTKYFNDMEDFVADKAYSSRQILEFLQKINLDPIIPFKKNVTGKARGSYTWGKMFKYFKEDNWDFMRRYHKRSNVETTFHMVKKRFGDNLTTKSLISNSNEIKIKFLCHNICVLIQEVFESNIDIDFEDCVKINNLCNNL